MSEKILPYDRAIVPQETGWWCGPASTQVVLNSRGIIRSEQSLANRIGTTFNGTNQVGMIAPILNAELPDADYVCRFADGDPMSKELKELLWADLVSSIDAGYGVVINIDAPVNNYPKGVKGSVSPSYGGGEVLHYIPAMGYDDNPKLRAVWIADSGFRPFGYWISFDQLASLVPPKGWAAATGGKRFLDHMSDGEQRELLEKVRDIFRQLAGANFSGWTQGGGRTLYDLNAATASKRGVTGTRDTKAR